MDVTGWVLCHGEGVCIWACAVYKGSGARGMCLLAWHSQRESVLFYIASRLCDANGRVHDGMVCGMQCV